jgi:hypothetical protein
MRENGRSVVLAHGKWVFSSSSRSVSEPTKVTCPEPHSRRTPSTACASVCHSDIVVGVEGTLDAASVQVHLHWRTLRDSDSGGNGPSEFG